MDNRRNIRLRSIDFIRRRTQIRFAREATTRLSRIVSALIAEEADESSAGPSAEQAGQVTSPSVDDNTNVGTYATPTDDHSLVTNIDSYTTDFSNTTTTTGQENFAVYDNIDVTAEGSSVYIHVQYDSDTPNNRPTIAPTPATSHSQPPISAIDEERPGGSVPLSALMVPHSEVQKLSLSTLGPTIAEDHHQAENNRRKGLQMWPSDESNFYKYPGRYRNPLHAAMRSVYPEKDFEDVAARIDASMNQPVRYASPLATWGKSQIASP